MGEDYRAASSGHVSARERSYSLFSISQFLSCMQMQFAFSLKSVWWPRRAIRRLARSSETSLILYFHFLTSKKLDTELKYYCFGVHIDSEIILAATSWREADI
jgi:hypothetical protein